MKKRKIAAYFFGVLAASVLLSLFVVSAAKDALALEKSGGDTAVALTENVGAREFSRLLKERGVIDMPIAFEIYAALRNKTSFGAGEYVFSAGMSYDEIFAASSGKKDHRQIKITVPEGLRTDEIIELFVSSGIGTREGFESALADDYGYGYIPQKPSGRTYRCDGYLYPDTYFFHTDDTERTVISKMLKNFDAKFSDKLRALSKKNGLDIDECVVLASVIQREAYYTAEMGALSSVLHNRLNSRALRRLECDSTVGYAWQICGGDGDFLSVDSPYNTYKHEGLPPGAICSPGFYALEAAANPRKSDYYYFFSKSDRTFVFSKTYGEHLANLKKFGVGSERS